MNVFGASWLITIKTFHFLYSLYSEKGPRNDEKVVKKRMEISCRNTLIYLFFLYFFGIEIIGFNTNTLQSIKLAIIPILVLFSGPILMDFDNLRKVDFDILFIRDVLVAPIIEELVFRVCSVSLLKTARISDFWAVVVCPLFFGFAHLHHFIESEKRIGFKRALIKVLVQFAYTTIFGIYMTFVLLKTRNVIGCCVGHMLCNYIGFPDFKISGLLWYFVGILGFGYLVINNELLL
jgi:prenyl protein peptidase